MFVLRRGLVALLLVAGVVGLGSGAVTARQERPTRSVEHVVRNGETLWGIARALKAGGDTRKTVDLLIRMNGLRSPGVRPGQRLVVPAL